MSSSCRTQTQPCLEQKVAILQTKKVTWFSRASTIGTLLERKAHEPYGLVPKCVGRAAQPQKKGRGKAVWSLPPPPPATPPPFRALFLSFAVTFLPFSHFASFFSCPVCVKSFLLPLNYYFFPAFSLSLSLLFFFLSPSTFLPSFLFSSIRAVSIPSFSLPSSSRYASFPHPFSSSFFSYSSLV